MPVDPSQWYSLGRLSWLSTDALVPVPSRLEPPEPVASAESVLSDGVPEFSKARAKAIGDIKAAIDQARAQRGSKRDTVAGWGSTGSERASDGLGAGRKFADLVWKSSGLGRLLGTRQARYMHRVSRMFEDGDLDRALRHAIPVSTFAGGELRRSLGVPSPRASLSIPRQSQSASSETIVPDDFSDKLREHYRIAAQRLEQAGRIEQAAYVLFELLRDDELGVALLERHRRYDMAAELAEGRELSPDLVVRLYFLAKKPARAIDVARRSGAFASAVRLLEQREPELGKRLRIAWADQAASHGDFVTAIDAIWPVEAARHLARAWLERAWSYSGPKVRARLWRRRASLDPSRFEELWSELQPELGSEEALEHRTA